MLLVLGVGEERQHVSQRCEGQIKIINVVLGKGKFVVPTIGSEGSDTTHLCSWSLVLGKDASM